MANTIKQKQIANSVGSVEKGNVCTQFLRMSIGTIIMENIVKVPQKITLELLYASLIMVLYILK